MSGRPSGPFGPHDLDDAAAGTRPSEADLAAALATGKRLEMIAQQQPIRPSRDFDERAWAAIAAEPLPAPVTAARAAIRRRSPGGLLVSIADARRVALGAGRPWPARGRALALLMAAALILASIGGAAVAGAMTLLAPAPAVTPLPSVPPTPTVTVSPEPSPSPSTQEWESPEPSTSAASSGSSETTGPNETKGPLETRTPGDTPKPSQTPRPSQTPEPSGSD